MTVLSGALGANYESHTVILTSGAQQTVFTVPTGFWWELVYLTISIGTGAAGTNGNVQWHNSVDGVTGVLNDAMPIASGIPGEWQGFPLHMETGSTLLVTAGTNYHVTYTVQKGTRNQPPSKSGSAPFLPAGIKS